MDYGYDFYEIITGQQANRNKVNISEIKKDFQKYCNKQSNRIDQDGMEKMGTALGIDIYKDIFITFFFFKCNCQRMEEVTEEEYITGLTAFGQNSLVQIKPLIITCREVLLDLSSPIFKDFYNFLFKFNMIKKSKTLELEVVDVYFKELFSDQFPIIKHFLLFITTIKKLTCLKKDEWECFLDFLLNQGSNFPNNYNCDEYYPLLFDEFYNWYKEINQ